ncbi:DUF6222 family protein [Amycolatopsis samaneae]|uniref:DUF6222 family protein n=1 Tax=Amycolatopsis samaneae TaxID=664691 RepID=A0ABW5GTJ1_9PSEU
MTTNEAVPVPDGQQISGAELPDPPPVLIPMPRLGRGIRWSDIVAEIESDNQARARGGERVRDAA